MAERTGIAWCDATFNPWIGCSKVSPGCAHCYAETLVTGRMARPGTWGDNGTRQVTSESNWKKPLRWAKLAREGRLPDGSPNPDGHRPRVFCASLADVFEDRPELDDARERLFLLIEATLELDWLLLTKRPDYMAEWLGGMAPPYPNAWLGTSIENARHTWRADILREIPAAVRFISAEPLLGSLFATKVSGPATYSDGVPVAYKAAPLDLTGIDWVIVGGESGPGARPMRLDWAREIVGHCRVNACGCPDYRAGVHEPTCTAPAVFVKQLGAKPTVQTEERSLLDGVSTVDVVLNLRDRKGGDITEWPADLQIREFPRAQEPA